jgi:hypothetical protein
MADFESTDYVCTGKGARLSEAIVAFWLCVTPGGIAAAALAGASRFLVATVTVIGTAAAVRRAFRLEIRANRERVVVRNYFRTRKFAWTDVTDIGVSTLTMGLVPLPAIAFAGNAGGLRAQATPTDASDRAHVLAMLAQLAPAHVRFHDAPLKRGSLARR